jgi:dihydrofolate reductase
MEDNGYITFYKTIDTLIMGSATYEQVLGFGDRAYAGKISYILTSRSLSTARNDIVFVREIEEALKDLKFRGFKRIWIKRE